jgi:hypothetical protein
MHQQQQRVPYKHNLYFFPPPLYKAEGAGGEYMCQ